MAGKTEKNGVRKENDCHNITHPAVVFSLQRVDCIPYWFRARLLQTSRLAQLPSIGSLLRTASFVFNSPTVFKQTTTLNAKTPEIHRPTTWSQFLQASALLRSIVPLRWLHSRRIMRRVKGSLATARFSSVFILTSFSAEVKASLYSFWKCACLLSWTSA